MRIILLSLTLTACVEYEVHTVEKEPNWFDETSDRLRHGIDDEGGEESDESSAPPPSGEPETDDEDTGSDAIDTGFWSGDDEGSGEGWSDSPDDEPGGSSGGSSGGSGGSSSGGSSGGGDSSARAPREGEVVITELMIDAWSVSDAAGEWMEVRNVSGAWLTLAGHSVGDRGVDGTDLVPQWPGALTVPPGGHLVFCAEADFWMNGGVTCNATFHYWTLGGGFALSNTEDEAILRDPLGWTLDEVQWGEGFAVEGEALGLNRNRQSIEENDYASNWCTQFSFMAFGDAGTPGEINDHCW